MPHPSKLTDQPSKRIKADEVPAPDRTPAEMLAILTRIVGRKVDRLNTITLNGAVELGDEYDADLDRAIDRVVKLAREERMADGPDLSTLSDDQLLALQKTRSNAPTSDE